MEGHILYHFREEITCFEDSLSLCKRPAISLLLVGLGYFIKKIQETVHIQWARKNGKLDFPTVS